MKTGIFKGQEIIDLAAKFGKVNFEGKSYVLIEQAVFYDRPNTEYPRMVADAIGNSEEQGGELALFRVFFKCKKDFIVEEWNGHDWRYKFTDDAPEYPDFSDMCDWDIVNEVVEVERIPVM